MRTENKCSYLKSLKKVRKIFFSDFSLEICHKRFCGEVVQLVKKQQRLLVIGYSQDKAAEPLRKG